MRCGSNELRSSPDRFHAGGISEVIQHGETGYIAEIGNYEQAASYIMALLTMIKIQNDAESMLSEILSGSKVRV